MENMEKVNHQKLENSGYQLAMTIWKVQEINQPLLDKFEAHHIGERFSFAQGFACRDLRRVANLIIIMYKVSDSLDNPICLLRKEPPSVGWIQRTADSFHCQPFAAEQTAEFWKYRLGPYIVDQPFNDVECLTWMVETNFTLEKQSFPLNGWKTGLMNGWCL